MPKYLCDDGNAEIEIEADSAEQAAQEYVDGGDWGDRSETCWITVYVQEVIASHAERADMCEPVIGARESITITLEAVEPECADGENHDWQSPHEVLGGLEESPGVWGHGGGVVIKCVCAYCGQYRITDTWAQNPATGEQGLESVRYEEADDASSEWIESLIADEDA